MLFMTVTTKGYLSRESITTKNIKCWYEDKHGRERETNHIEWKIFIAMNIDIRIVKERYHTFYNYGH